MKKETIEEAAERLCPNDGYYDEIYCDIGEFNREKWIEGAKWQQEQMYSEEEVIQTIRDLKFDSIYIGDINPEKWFEQFKKK